MAQDLVLQTDDKPSFFNKELVVGALVSSLIIPGGGLIAAGLGAAIGGFIGKKRMEREERQGKVILEHHTPLNKDTFIGSIVGLAAGDVAAGIVTTFLLGTVAAPVVAVAALSTIAVGTIAGAIVGNKFSEKQHDAEYEQAKHQTIVRSLSANVSPEVGSAVEYALDNNKSWAKDVTTRRLLEQSQQR